MPKATQQRTTLTEADCAHLQRSHIPRDLAIRAGLFRVDSHEGAELIGQVNKKGAPRKNCAGIVFPYRLPEGSEAREYRLRRDSPEQDTSGKELDKYLAAPGRSNLFYFAPQAKAAWMWETTVPVVFVEGEKKTLALQRFFDERGEQVLVIGLSGVWNWKGTVGKTTSNNGARVSIKGPIKDFDLLDWKQRKVEIIFDADAKNNIAVVKARKALAVHLRKQGATVRMLEMPDFAETGCKGIDDLLGKHGAGFVADWLDRARANTKPDVVKIKIAGYTFLATEQGVTAQGLDEHDNAIGSPVAVCSPLCIKAITRDEHAANFGRLLEFTDPDGNEKQWAMPASLLSGDKATYEGYLRDQGVDIFNSKHLHTYLASKSDKRVLVVSRTGWHKGAFVFADECIGSDDGEEIFHQSSEGGNHLMRVAGTLADWQTNVACYCPGNSRLLLAVSAGFAATLLGKLKIESGGFHLRGISSTGKTTALLVGGSVWGGGSDKGFLRRYRATINGLEGVAASHNDALLCLDEIAEVDPWQAGETVYMLANGQGKIRLNKNISLRKPQEWQLLFLSSGEISLTDHLATVGKRVRGGMEVRLIDLPADAGQGFGAWEELHEFNSGKEFSDHLQEASKTHYGTAAREFIRRLIEQPADELREAWRAYKAYFLKTHCPPNAKEEVGRVCDRFALVAFAGEMASEAGITGWTASDFEAGTIGDATQAMAKLFLEWLGVRGTGRSDEEMAIQQVRLFLERYTDSRFRRLGSGDERTINDHAGYVERNNEGEITTWYILPEVFRAEVCKGYEVKQVAKMLQARGWLRTTHDLRCEKRTPEGKKKMYAITGIFTE